MMNKIVTSQKGLQCFVHNSLLIIVCLLLISCSGGISGTGDGGPIVVIDGNTEGSGDVGDAGPISSTPDGTEADSSVMQEVYAHQIFPATLSPQYSAALLASSVLDQRIPALPVISVTQKVSNQLAAVNQQISRIQLDLANIEEHLIDQLQQCDSTNACDSIPTEITTTLSSATLDFQVSLQPDTTQATPTVGDQSRYTNISYTGETPGYFDQKLEYSAEDGTTVVLQWTANKQLVSLQFINRSQAISILSDLTQTRTTLRSEDRVANTVFYATTLGSASTATTIEADLNSDQQYYVRATADENSVTLYSLHPTDSSAARIREAFDLPLGNYVVESCIATNSMCENWQTVASDDSQIDTRFTATEFTLADFSKTISSNLQVTVPADVNEFVIATGNAADQPEIGSLVCGAQRVLNAVRSFCWQPLPLAGTLQIYEEDTGNGSPVYRRLPDALVQ